MSVQITKKRLDAAVARWQRDKRHLRVRYVGANSYRVINGDGKKYTQNFFYDATGAKCASCDCKCGMESEQIMCVHAAAALMLHCIRVRQNPAASVGAAHPSFCDQIEIDHIAEEREAAIYEELCGEGFQPDAFVDYPPLVQSRELYPDELDEQIDAFAFDFTPEGEDLGYFKLDDDLEEAILKDPDPQKKAGDDAILFKPESAARCERIGKIRI